jgi:hypothetical protein
VLYMCCVCCVHSAQHIFIANGDMLSMLDPKNVDNKSLHDLIQAHGGVNLLITDAPYNQKKSSSGMRLSTDRFTCDQMATFMSKVYDLMSDTSHMLIRVSEKDFGDWNEKAIKSGFKVDRKHIVMKQNDIVTRSRVMRNGKKRPSYAIYLHCTKNLHPKLNKDCHDWTGHGKNPTTGFYGVRYVNKRYRIQKQLPVGRRGINARTECFRDEVTMQEVAQYISWYTTSGDLVWDPMAGTMPAGKRYNT